MGQIGAAEQSGGLGAGRAARGAVAALDQRHQGIARRIASAGAGRWRNRIALGDRVEQCQKGVRRGIAGRRWWLQGVDELLLGYAAGAVGVELGKERIGAFLGAAGLGDRLLDLALRDRAVAVAIDLGKQALRQLAPRLRAARLRAARLRAGCAGPALRLVA